MTSELEFSEYEMVKPFFRDSESDFVLSAILEQNSPAQIWVDNKLDPRSVLLWDKANNVFYLSGDENNKLFDNHVEQLVEQRVIRELVKRSRLYFRIRALSDMWIPRLSAFFKGTDLVKNTYGFYSCGKRARLNWKSSIPLGLHVERIDEEFLSDPKYNLELVTQEIESMWTSIDRFIEFGFGFSLVTKREIVCWCTAEYLSKGKCGIGIETMPKYRNRGFATLAASAFVECCKLKGIKPHWECNLSNIASRRVAEKVGFTKEQDFIVHSGVLTP